MRLIQLDSVARFENRSLGRSIRFATVRGINDFFFRDCDFRPLELAIIDYVSGEHSVIVRLTLIGQDWDSTDRDQIQADVSDLANYHLSLIQGTQCRCEVTFGTMGFLDTL